MAARSPQREGAAAFLSPEGVNQRRYEALRAFFVEGCSYAEVAARFGYSYWGVVDLVRQHRKGGLSLFAPPPRPGRKPGVGGRKVALRARVVELRREGLSSYEISARLSAEQTPLNRTSVGEILAEEGFGRLLRRPEREASVSPATHGRDTNLPRARVIDFAVLPTRLDTVRAGLALVLPDLVALDLPGLLRQAGYPGTAVVPATSWLLSLLCLKLTATRRVSHVDDLLADPTAGLVAGMAVLPKKSALTSYSYRLTHEHQRAFLAALDKKLVSAGLATAEQAIFDLDFHAVMHWGNDPVLERHYVPKRSQRARSVLTFFAQDSGTHNLVYANADLQKATQAREVIAFCDHWREVSGADPYMVVMDQRVTTHAVLGELDARGVRFLTLRMRSPSLLRKINALAPADYRRVELDRPAPYDAPRVHEEAAVAISDYPGTVRQLVVAGLGREAPSVIITNEAQLSVRALVEHYARRMTIEQRLAEIIRAFSTDALSSTVNVNVDLDVMLAVLAQALLAALRSRLVGYATATPDTIQRRFLETPGEILSADDTVTVRLARRAYSPVLRQASLPQETAVPWWGGRRLRFEFT
jgi:transposase